MYYEEQKIIVNKTNIGKNYIIDVDSGFKAEFDIRRNEIHCWPDKIKRIDIEKARNDGVDISHIKYPYAGYFCKEVQLICSKIENFLKFSTPENICKVSFHLI